MRIGLLISKSRLGTHGFRRTLLLDSTTTLATPLLLYYWKEIVVVPSSYTILHSPDFTSLGSNPKNDTAAVLYWILMTKNDWVWSLARPGTILTWYSYTHIWHRNVYCRVTVGTYRSCITRSNVPSYHNMIRAQNDVCQETILIRLTCGHFDVFFSALVTSVWNES